MGGVANPLVTDDVHGSARIAGIDGARLGEGFAAGEIAVVAGFQGVHKATNRVTTLGRGGSDTSAVALAAAISADRCDIYTDVDGVYTSDPRVVPKARRLAKVAFEEMLEMASLGAKVLQVRSVELAMVNKVRLYVRSSFDDPAHPQLGTLICDEEEIMEQEVAPASPSRATRRRSRCVMSRTSPGSPRRSSCRWPTPTSTST